MVIYEVLHTWCLKVDCRGKPPMHIIVWICLFGHAMHKTTFLIILLWYIFEILSHKATSAC